MVATNISFPRKRLLQESGALKGLPVAIQEWFDLHSIEPRKVSLSHDSEGKHLENYWLITDHTGQNDSPFRVYYDEEKDRFGRECLLENGIPLLLGVYPSLFDVLEDIL